PQVNWGLIVSFCRVSGTGMEQGRDEDWLDPQQTSADLCCRQAVPLFPEVVPLNIGGAHFTTRLSTLRRYEDTMLAAMFSGRHYIPTDAEGRYFIDRDGTHFGYVSIHRPLCSPDHLERIVEIARLRAVQRKARFAKLKTTWSGSWRSRGCGQCSARHASPSSRSASSRRKCPSRRTSVHCSIPYASSGARVMVSSSSTTVRWTCPLGPGRPWRMSTTCCTAWSPTWRPRASRWTTSALGSPVTETSPGGSVMLCDSQKRELAPAPITGGWMNGE
uniref:Potassium channel tetramerisation-type BTB domain-containing protein n=1 Tax=Spermophilus dauricus TaxID=99837 RepID=A0A8C9Q2E4_SPEDA